MLCLACQIHERCFEGLDSSCVTSLSLPIITVRVFTSALWFDLYGHIFYVTCIVFFNEHDTALVTGECFMIVHMSYATTDVLICNKRVTTKHNRQHNRQTIETSSRYGLNWPKPRLTRTKQLTQTCGCHSQLYPCARLSFCLDSRSALDLTWDLSCSCLSESMIHSLTGVFTFGDFVLKSLHCATVTRL